MGSKILLALILLLLFSASILAIGCGTPTSGASICTETLSTTNCLNITNSIDCVNYVQLFGHCDSGAGTTTYKFRQCIFGPPCKVGSVCRNPDTPIPEFFGIEFGEMEISTGIIAVIGAIVLPMFLFRKKK